MGNTQNTGLLGYLGDAKELRDPYLLGIRLDDVNRVMLDESLEVSDGGQALAGSYLDGGPAGQGGKAFDVVRM